MAADDSRFGSYVVRKPLRTQGDYVRIFLASREGSDKLVELHVLTQAVSDRSPEFQRFLNEFQTLAGLEHPGVVKVLDMGLHDGKAYYATPASGALPLVEVVEGGRTFTVAETVDLGVQVADALAYLHGRRILHRDVGPQTVYWHAPFKRAIVSGFALAKNFRLTNLTARGISTPSQLRVTPEQVEDLPYDERTDCYLLGDLLYWLLTGTVALTLDFKPAMASTRNPAVPADLDAVLAAMLQARPEDRLQTATDVRSALKKIKAA